MLISSGAETCPRFQWASDQDILSGRLELREFAHCSPWGEYIRAGSQLKLNHLWHSYGYTPTYGWREVHGQIFPQLAYLI